MTAEEKRVITELLENEYKMLESVLTDKISELHKVQGGQTERHAFMYYRSELWEIRDLLKSLL